MSTDHKSTPGRKAPAASPRPAPRAAAERILSILTEPPPKVVQERSSDPYNTSGSFDRTKNWARVGKR